MIFVWVLESKGMHFEHSAAVALMGKYNVRLFNDPVTFIQEYARIQLQQNFYDQHLIYLNTYQNKILDVKQILREINPKYFLVQDLSSHDLIILSVNEMFKQEGIEEVPIRERVVSKDTVIAPAEGFKYKELHLNLIRLECYFEEDLGVQSLSPKEAFILAYLMKHAGCEVDRLDLSKAVWGETKVSNRTLDSHISRLRSKLNQQGDVMIESVYGGGYILR